MRKSSILLGLLAFGLGLSSASASVKSELVDSVSWLKFTGLETVGIAYNWDSRYGRTFASIHSQVFSVGELIGVDIGAGSQVDCKRLDFGFLGGSLKGERLLAGMFPETTILVRSYVPELLKPLWHSVSFGPYIAHKFDEAHYIYGLRAGLLFRFE